MPTDRWALLGYAVSSGDLRAPYDRQILVALISSLVALLATVLTGLALPWKLTLRPAATLWRDLGEVGQLILSAITSLALMLGLLLTWGSGSPALFRRDSVQLGLAILTGGIIYLHPGLILYADCTGSHVCYRLPSP